jgi:hypothetical protein
MRFNVKYQCLYRRENMQGGIIRVTHAARSGRLADFSAERVECIAAWHQSLYGICAIFKKLWKTVLNM